MTINLKTDYYLITPLINGVNLAERKLIQRATRLKPIDLLMNGKKKRITLTMMGKKNTGIKRQIRWVMGDEPAGVINPGPGKFSKGGGERIISVVFWNVPGLQIKWGLWQSVLIVDLVTSCLVTCTILPIKKGTLKTIIYPL